MIVLESCGGKTEESVTEFKNGAFKIDVRSQEFHHSAIRNIDVCVAETSSGVFPDSKAQCFFHGFDFSGLTVRWKSQREIEVSFECGRVSSFKNWAIVSPEGSTPVDFHATLHDGCDKTDTTALLGTSVRGLADTTKGNRAVDSQ